MILYFLVAALDLRKIQSRSPDIRRILETALWARIWVAVIAALEVVLSVALLLQCRDIGVLVPTGLAL
jgi:hypothetical protein